MKDADLLEVHNCFLGCPGLGSRDGQKTSEHTSTPNSSRVALHLVFLSPEPESDF